MSSTWWDEVSAVIEEKNLLKHPFYQAWSRGELTREDLAHYAGQYYRQESRFPSYIRSILADCGDAKAREVLFDNLRHEESEPKSHPEMWLDFAESVGASRESVFAAPAARQTAACVEAFERLSARGAVAGMAALYAYEAQQPAVAATKIEGLKVFYGVKAPEALRFFEVHQEMDAWHSESEKQILLDQAAKNPDLKVEIKAAVSEACDALNGLLTGVCEARGIRCATTTAS